ncbi:MAG: YecA family protein [Moraxellaceae bacterium]|nr:MAG: YecA family protein [Moraxellaceae bacterium]
MQDDISGWNDWNAAFGEIPELTSPSELHGLVMGIVTVAQAPTADEWQHLLSQLAFEPLEARALQLLVDEGEDAAAALADDSLDYMPLLPDDQHLLEERVQCLADWCDGVVLGFGLGSGQLRADEAELLQDLQEVAAVEFDSDDDDEEGEASYAELVEFVRLIPVSLATGRSKHALSDTAMFKVQAKSLKTVSDGSVSDGNEAGGDGISVVEMFTPQRPS